MLQDKDYVELLQKYSREKLRPRFRARCIKYCMRWTYVGRHPIVIAR